MRFVSLVTTSLMAVLAAAQVTLPKWYGRIVSVLALVRAKQRTMECSAPTLWVVTKRLEIFQENSRMKYLWETLTMPTAAISKRERDETREILTAENNRNLFKGFFQHSGL